jgi:hypothetical protein
MPAPTPFHIPFQEGPDTLFGPTGPANHFGSDSSFASTFSRNAMGLINSNNSKHG